MNAHSLAPLLLGALLCACATSPPPLPLDSVDAVASQVTINDSDFDTYRAYRTPAIKSTFKRGGGLYPSTDSVKTTLTLLRHKPSGKTTLLLSAYIEYGGGWRFYESASLQGGALLQSKATKRNVESCRRSYDCDFNESVVFDLPFNISTMSRSGFSIRVNAKQGPELMLVVPPTYVDGLLQASAAR